jgi:hypothetical protein
MNTLKPNNATPINIEAEAYRNGIAGTPIDDSLSETQAEFDTKIAETERESLEKIKNLETEKEITSLRRQEAESRWVAVKVEVESKTPYLVSFVLIGLFGVLGFSTESVLLQRIADIFGIAEPLWQYLFAVGVVGFLTLLAELVIWAWQKSEQINRLAVYVYGGLVIVGFIALGIYRAYILEGFEAADDAVLLKLFGDTFYLNKAVMVFLTVGLPIAVAFAFEYSKAGLNLWLRWFKARRDAIKFEKHQETATKKFEAANETLAKQLEAIKQTCESWKAAQRQAHTEGLNNQAIRRPFWEILGLLIGGTFLILFAVFIVKVLLIDTVVVDEIMSLMATLTLGFGLVGLFTFYIIKRWNSPTAEQFYRQRTVIWQSDKIKLPAKTTQIIAEKEVHQIGELAKAARV